MIIVFYILAVTLIFLSYKSFRGGIDYLTYFKTELAKPQSDFMPFATIIAPCKGLDEDLEQNLAVLLEQDYPEYEVVFVVDDENDQAVKVIDEISRKAAQKTKLVIAEKTTESSQKVENLREAVLHIDGKTEVLAFVDSDTRPSNNWLRNLVAPLENERVGAATGYRWFVSKTPTFASEMRSAWNASIASALGRNTRTNFCWGGSMAIRREVFEGLDIRAKWKGTLSDDFTITRTLNEANLPILFVPQALTASIGNCDLQELFEFTTRQMKITRVYAPKLWMRSFFGSGLFNFVLGISLAIIIFSQRNDALVFAAIITVVVVALFSIGKSWLRLKAVRLVLQEYDRDLSRQSLTQTTFWLFTPALFFLNSFAAWISRKMTWRGVTYKLVSPTETRILARVKGEKVLS